MKYLPAFLILFFIFPYTSYSQWTLQNSGTSKTLYSVDFTNPNSGWVAGASDIIKQSRDGGETWSIYNGQLFPSYRNWYALKFANEDEGYACGDYFLDWYEAWWTYTINGGNSWVRPPSGSYVPNTSRWTDVFFLNDKLGWKVGFRNGVGRVSKTITGVGSDWGSTILVPNLLFDVMFVNENMGWMVGSAGSIYRTTDSGEEWVLQNTGTTKSLRAVYFTDHLTGWAVGHQNNQAIILNTRNGGQLWTSIEPPDVKELHAVHFTDSHSGWACGSLITALGNKGVILQTVNGGSSWEIIHIEDNCSTLYDMDFVNGVAYAVGSSGVILKNIIGEDFLRFTSLSDMNHKKFGFGYTCDGHNIYTVGGQRPSPWSTWISSEIDRYDIANDSWTELSNKLIPRRYCSAEFIPSMNKIYIFNGDTYTSDTYTDTVEIFDIVTKTITYSPSNPYPVEYGGSAQWNNKIYLFGGSNADGYSKHFFEFDPLTNNWNRLADMPEPKQTNGEIIDGVLYVFGGYNFFTSKKIHAYDIENESWSTLEGLPFGVSAHAIAKSGKNIWLIGSYDNISFIAVYNTQNREFTQLYSDMTGRRHAGAVVAGEDLYVFGGNQASSYETILNSTQFVDVSDFVNAVDHQVEKKQFGGKIYPNPFSTSLSIDYELTRSEKLIFQVFDCYGREVENKNYFREAGKQKLEWQASGLTNGIYFYQLKAGSQILSGKILKVQ